MADTSPSDLLLIGSVVPLDKVRLAPKGNLRLSAFAPRKGTTDADAAAPVFQSSPLNATSEADHDQELGSIGKSHAGENQTADGASVAPRVASPPGPTRPPRYGALGRMEDAACPPPDVETTTTTTATTDGGERSGAPSPPLQPPPPRPVRLRPLRGHGQVRMGGSPRSSQSSLGSLGAIAEGEGPRFADTIALRTIEVNGTKRTSLVGVSRNSPIPGGLPRSRDDSSPPPPLPARTSGVTVPSSSLNELGSTRSGVESPPPIASPPRATSPTPIPSAGASNTVSPARALSPGPERALSPTAMMNIVPRNVVTADRMGFVPLSIVGFLQIREKDKWRSRYCVVSERVLFIYASAQGAGEHPLQSVPLPGYRLSQNLSRDGRLQITLRHSSTKVPPLKIQCDHKEGMRWITVLVRDALVLVDDA